MKNQTGSSLLPLCLDSLLALAFFSVLTSFIEATYTFGLLGTDIPPEIVYVLFLVSPVLLLVFPRLLESRAFTLATGAHGLLFWGISLPLDTRWRMLATGLGVGFLLLHFVARARQSARREWELAAGLGMGVLASIFLRSLHSGAMALSSGPSLLLGEVLAAATICLLIFPREPAATPAAPPTRGTAERAGFWRSLGLTLGIFSVMALLYFGFTSPVVLARWGEASYPLVVLVEAGALSLFLGACLRRPGFHGPMLLAAWNVLFLAALACTLLARQPLFPSGAAYPLYAPAPGVPASVAYWAMLMLHPVIYVDFGRLVGAVKTGRPSPRALAGAAAAGSLFLLLLASTQIFTTVYDYIPIIGPWFRDRFWLVVSAPALVVTLAALLPGKGRSEDRPSSSIRLACLLGAVSLAAASLLLSVLTAAHPPTAQPVSSLRILTWNLQQGYGKTGEKSVDLQLETIRFMKPDILGLQETDTARIAGGNSDLVRYLADRLGMYSYYGPSPEAGTFGIALLSRYPIQDPRTFFMPSRGEQTATIEAGVSVGGKLFRLLVTHLDNDGATSQQRVILQRASGGALASGALTGAAVIVMGDFNFSPSTEQYRLTTATLADAWVDASERIVHPKASDPGTRIDHIFLSRGTRVARSEYLPEGPSDHPAMFAEISW